MSDLNLIGFDHRGKYTKSAYGGPKTKGYEHQPLTSGASNMEGHDRKGKPVRIEQVIAVGLCGNKTFMQDTASDARRNNANKPVEMMHIYGIANGVATIEPKKDSTNQRPTVYIKGSFDADNLVQPMHYISGQLILPDSASSYVVTRIETSKEPMYLDIIIELHPSEKSILGYKFIGQLYTLMPADQWKAQQAEESKPADNTGQNERLTRDTKISIVDDGGPSDSSK